jgi:hypothetical protein
VDGAFAIDPDDGKDAAGVVVEPEWLRRAVRWAEVPIQAIEVPAVEQANPAGRLDRKSVV